MLPILDPEDDAALGVDQDVDCGGKVRRVLQHQKGPISALRLDADRVAVVRAMDGLKHVTA